MLTISILISAVLLLAWPYRPWQWCLAMIGAVLVSALAMLHVVSDRFTGEGITLAVLAHVLYGWRNGELGIDRFPWLVAGVVGWIFALSILGYAGWRLMRRRGRIKSATLRWLALPAGMVAIFVNPAAQDLWILQQATENVGEELHAELQWNVSSPANKTKSFVWIYLESMERAFLDQERLPGVAPGLAALEREHLSFRGLRTAPFMNWTVAGMVASQCGMPFEPIAKQGAGYQPGASCLGDLLAESGYELSYIGGADLAFSGKGRFFRTHGYSTVLGFDDLRDDAPEHSIWGVYDEVVFARAQTEFNRLKKSGKPFGLVLLTTATHPPDGYVSADCPREQHFDNPMLASAHCSDGQVVKLVQSLLAHAPDDMLIFISSDHLQVAGAAHGILQQAASRENTLIVLGQGEGVVQRASTMVDVAPTIASFLGFDARAIGLGRDLMRNEPTLVEKYGYASFISMLPGWRVGLRNGQPYELCNPEPQPHRQDVDAAFHITQVLCRADEP